MERLRDGSWTFTHFLQNGLVEYLDVNEVGPACNACVVLGGARPEQWTGLGSSHCPAVLTCGLTFAHHLCTVITSLLEQMNPVQPALILSDLCLSGSRLLACMLPLSLPCRRASPHRRARPPLLLAHCHHHP